MHPSRRDFLRTCGAGAAAWATTVLVPGRFIFSRAEAAPMPADKLQQLGAFALERAKSARASYAD
ncbi:MAG TPA: twin-arginine translocation signal domain-containing protein, partial [Myxococcaceae bacterium]|nr:twin-arginine translocation signal domain-containing protein [Myxococcaceae bacterium]